MNKSIFIQSVYFAGNVIGKNVFNKSCRYSTKTQKAVLCCKLHVTAISNIKLLWTVLKAIDYQSFKLIDKLTKSTFNEFRQYSEMGFTASGQYMEFKLTSLVQYKEFGFIEYRYIIYTESGFIESVYYQSGFAESGYYLESAFTGS